MAGKDSDGGGRHRENVYAACSDCVVVLALRRPSSLEAFREKASRGPLSVLLSS